MTLSMPQKYTSIGLKDVELPRKTKKKDREMSGPGRQLHLTLCLAFDELVMHNIFSRCLLCFLFYVIKFNDIFLVGLSPSSVALWKGIGCSEELYLEQVR